MFGTIFPEKEWVELIERIHADRGELHYQKLSQIYSEPQRHYHTLDHIYQCICEFRDAPYLSEHPNEIEMAIWFHDAVYVPGKKDNEQQSARLAQKFLKKIKMPDFFIKRVGSLILATKHKASPKSLDAKVIVDVDLSILGKSEQDFDRYETGIRQEYRYVPEEQFKQGRAAILEGFLNRDSIYSTDFFRKKYEEQARKNLQKSIAELRRNSFI